jgi:hypothetical protein
MEREKGCGSYEEKEEALAKWRVGWARERWRSGEGREEGLYRGCRPGPPLDLVSGFVM